MIDFKDKDAQVPSAIIVASLLILLGTLIFMIVVPHPAPQNAFSKENQVKTYKNQAEQAKLSEAEAQKTSDALVFRGNPEDIMARALAMLTDRAQKVQVQITAFRPQKTVTLGGLTELPVSIQIAGPYPDLLTFVNGLNAPGSRVAVSSFQVASSGDATSTVQATVAIALFAPATDAAADSVPKAPAAATAKPTASLVAPADSATPIAAPAMTNVRNKGVRHG